MHKIMAVVLLTTLMTAAGLLFAPQAQASFGYHLYSWGVTAQRGRPVGVAHPDGATGSVPGRVEGNTRWISSATSAQGSLAVRADGTLWAFTATSMDQVGDRDDWVQVSARSFNRVALSRAGNVYRFYRIDAPNIHTTPALVPGSQAGGPWVDIMAGNSAVYAINGQGQLWSVATVSSPNAAQIAAVGRGGINSTTWGRVTVPYTATTCNLVWTSMRAGADHVIATTSNGMLWSWGSNTNEKLGRPVTPVGGTIGTIPIVANNQPGRVGRSVGCAGFRTNWIAAGATNGGAAALNSAGHVYTWGSSEHQQLGRPYGPAPNTPANTPGRVVPALLPNGNESGPFVSLHGGNSHYLAFTADGDLFSWGSNLQGQLGLGTTGGSFGTPQHIIRAYNFSDAARGGGSASLMLMDLTPAQTSLDLQKNFRRLEGAPFPDSLSFQLEVQAFSFNGNTNQAHLVPSIPLANRTVTITPASTSTTAGGVTTLTETLTLFESIEFTAAGAYGWIIYTIPNTTGVNTEPPGLSRMTYSQARYYVRVHVSATPGVAASFFVAGITIDRTRTEDGVNLSPHVSVNPAVPIALNATLRHFTTGTVTCPGALLLTTTIEGDFFDADTEFDFDVTLTRTALCAANASFIGRVYNADGTFNREYSFNTGTSRHVVLLDGHYLVFPELPVGVSWVATKRAIDGFTAALERTVNGTSHSRVTNPHPDLLLSTGSALITAANLANHADFFAIHFFTPPMGLVIGNGSLYFLVLGAGFMTTTLLVLKTRQQKKGLSPNTPIKRR